MIKVKPGCMVIREIKESDNKLLADLIRNVFEEHHAPTEGTVYSDPTTEDLYKVFSNYRSILWVAEKNNEIIGCCGIYPTKGLPEDCAELVKFYLLSSARGKGIGTTLIMRSMKSALGLGYKILYLESLPQFKMAVKMYKKLGFMSLDGPLGESGHTSCNIWMIKFLR